MNSLKLNKTKIIQKKAGKGERAQEQTGRAANQWRDKGAQTNSNYRVQSIEHAAPPRKAETVTA